MNAGQKGTGEADSEPEHAPLVVSFVGWRQLNAELGAALNLNFDDAVLARRMVDVRRRGARWIRNAREGRRARSGQGPSHSGRFPCPGGLPFSQAGTHLQRGVVSERCGPRLGKRLVGGTHDGCA